MTEDAQTTMKIGETEVGAETEETMNGVEEESITMATVGQALEGAAGRL